MIYIVPTDTCFGIGCGLFDTTGYELVYTAKNRPKNKPLAVLVPTWEDLFEATSLTRQQKQFLVDYDHAWTLLADVKESFRSGTILEDRDMYPQVAIRVGEVCVDESVYSQMTTPFFLTSANISDQGVPQDIAGIKKDFKKYLPQIMFLPGKNPPGTESDIFSFEKDTTSIRYVRKIS